MEGLVNYNTQYKHKGRVIFVPTPECRAKGNKLLDSCSGLVAFPENFFHYQPGGHVAAIHWHLKSTNFFKVDISNFYYRISRNRVAAALHEIGFKKARTYAKWSCVKNPYSKPSYSLPIGFVQSAFLASLVLMRSPVAEVLSSANAAGVKISVYFDDLIGSSTDPVALRSFYHALIAACAEANLPVNTAKLTEPSTQIVAFNCDLREGFAEVTAERIKKFFDSPHSAAGEVAFNAYAEWVKSANASSHSTSNS